MTLSQDQATEWEIWNLTTLQRKQITKQQQQQQRQQYYDNSILLTKGDNICKIMLKWTRIKNEKNLSGQGLVELEKKTQINF